jgi:eukaryotic-like serine/threonine-protein kinase
VSAETYAGGRYRVERILGDGAMAKVVLARDGELDRQVAVKLLDEQLAEDPSFRARFAREARVAAALSHPNVVTVFDVGEAEGRPYIVMEYVEGRPLDERLRREGPLPAEEVRRIGLQVCDGLEHAHANGLIHRDLKPGNLIERADGTIKIADFGIARSVDASELTEAGTIIGTAAYLAPEQAEDGELTHATDVFSLGVVLYELLTGRHPWKVDSLAGLAARSSVPPAELPAETPHALRVAIERALAIDPADRPSSAGELARLLDEPDEEATMVLPTARRRPRRARTRPRTGVWLVALLGALVLGLAALGIAVLATDGGEEGAGSGRPTTPAQVEPIADGATPTEDARNLADWLRENSR